ncbi:hypothetical protein VOLCADRAFT_96457 [Volvox carteri f. nagariensis]|uniref:Uncharacterized protein n=1 Tax=Volvox carteri f. nagariensis TaxID=3068 RepID=D8UA58_VOLCA|nr:uncharacterized protein VOLCADRAFT_96457 [Volvox carteri f. nagariensis]EFJ43369.1 hypothetical protein VOLCADRAFT_96457 [Volvox carteri f. nagariensis]|eukprot:XP_002955516.1 hypothetical protein VOLCADRAFT_96457 [Volvox carteri f. nagariensis]
MSEGAGPEERAARSYRAAAEDELLAALKHETIVRTISYKEDTGGQDPPRNSPPSLAAGAFGKYASAIAAERHLSPVAVMGSVGVPDSRDALPSEEELAQRLAQQAEAAYSAERASGGGLVGRSGIASKLQSAADKFARMVALDKAPTDSGAADPHPDFARQVVAVEADRHQEGTAAADARLQQPPRPQ